MDGFTTALVTGATSGIGTVIAERLAADGMHVLVGGRDEARAAAVVGRIRAAGGRADALLLDLAADPERIRAAAEGAARLAGPVEVLVNNAAHHPVGPSEQLPDDDARRILHVNVLAPHVLAAALVPGMVPAGAIVNVGSWMGRLGTPSGALYSASKAAIEQLTRSWAAEWGPRGVRVNAVVPGVTLTEGNERHRPVLDGIAATTPARALVRSADVAAAVAFLLSPAARMVQGTAIAVDGGISGTRP